MSIELLLRAAGALQLLQLPAVAIAQRHLGWRRDLARLSPVNRHLVIVVGIGIVVYVVGTGAIALCFPQSIARTELGFLLTVLQTNAWLIRAQYQIVCIRPLWPQRVYWLYRCTTLIYVALSLLYFAVSALWASR